MKLKLVVVDLEMSPRARRLLLRVGLPIAIVLGGGAIAYAGNLHTWSPNDPLTAADLNGNFSALDTRITNLEAAPPGLKFEGFSAAANAFPKPAGWAAVIANQPVYNTFAGTTYDFASGVFTAPKAGYYRFSLGGWSSASAASPDTRIGFDFTKNGVGQAISGGQISATDTPLPSFSYTMHLAVGDKVGVSCYTPGAITLGGNGGGDYLFWFQGEFVGN